MSELEVGLSLGVVRPIIEALWTPNQAAAYLAVSVDWVYEHVSRLKPNLPAIFLGEQSGDPRPLIRFRREDLEAWVEQHRSTPPLSEGVCSLEPFANKVSA